MFFCFVFQEILYGFGEEFFSPHSRRCRELLSVVVRQCATRDGEKKNCCDFFVVLIVEFRLWSGSQNRILAN